MKFDTVIIGGGLAGLTAGCILLRAGQKVAAVTKGLSLNEAPRNRFVALGGVYLPGDSVLPGGDWRKNRLLRVYTKNLGKTPLEAENFILSTGKFFSRGLIATMSEIKEPLFNCELDYDTDRGKWCVSEFFERQPFENFGVRTDGRGRVFVNGRVAENLYAAGEILAGEIDIEQSAAQLCRNLI